jgi:hypothetical protein
MPVDAPKAAIPNQSEPVSATEIYKQLHETCRSVVTLYIGWFTFFITLNFAVLGWLAKNDPSAQTNRLLLYIIAVAFIIFTVLGIVAGAIVRAQVRATNAEVANCLGVTAHAKSLADVSIPASRYNGAIKVIFAALLVLMVVWIVVIMHAR